MTLFGKGVRSVSRFCFFYMWENIFLLRIIFLLDVVYIYNGILLSIRKNAIMPFAATWVDLEIIIVSEVRERQIPYDITYMWNLKYNTNQYIYEI